MLFTFTVKREVYGEPKPMTSTKDFDTFQEANEHARILTLKYYSNTSFESDECHIDTVKFTELCRDVVNIRYEASKLKDMLDKASR